MNQDRISHAPTLSPPPGTEEDMNIHREQGLMENTLPLEVIIEISPSLCLLLAGQIGVQVGVTVRVQVCLIVEDIMKDEHLKVIQITELNKQTIEDKEEEEEM